MSQLKKKKLSSFPLYVWFIVHKMSVANPKCELPNIQVKYQTVVTLVNLERWNRANPVVSWILGPDFVAQGSEES